MFKSCVYKLLDWVLAGEDVVSARSGKPIARLTPIESLPEPRIPGIDAGKIIIAADFDRLLIAQSRVEDIPLLTADFGFMRYLVQVVW